MATPIALTGELFVDGAWVSYPLYAEAGWEAQIGPDVETGTRPSRIGLQFANPDLSMDPSNVSSPLYGKIGRNTKARLRINAIHVTQAEASSWQPDATEEHIATGSPGAPRGKAWVDFAAEGVLRRIGRWTDPIRSAMARTERTYPGLLGLWTLEDEQGAATLSNDAPGGVAASYNGTVTLAGSEGAGGSAESIKMGSDGNLRGKFLTTGTVNGYQITWAMKLAAIPASATFLPVMAWVDNLNRTYRLTFNNTNFGVDIIDTDGTALVGTSVAFSPTPPNQWVTYRVKVSVSGGTVSVEIAWYPQDGIAITGYTVTYAAASAGRPARWTAWGNAATDGAGYGHVVGISDTAFNLLGGSPLASFDGYNGETTWARYYRLLTQEGFSGYVIGTALPAVQMGRQKPGTLLELFEECVRTEGGLLYDEPTDIATTFVTNRSLINKTPSLTLSKSQLVAPLLKTIDDVGIVNDVTVKNADGSSARAELATGAVSTAVPPAGVGRVKGLLEVNQRYPSRLADRANYELRKGTLDRPRYLQVTLDLLQNPTLTDAVSAMRPGAWIVLTGVEPDPVTLRVISISRSGGPVQHTAVFNCLPAEVHTVGVYGATGSRYDSSSTTLAAAITTTTATSISLTTAKYNDRWSTATPYQIKIGGERMTVTAMTAGAGAGPVTQTATVTRSVNGVVKTHLIGAEVHLADIVRYTLI